MTLDALVCAPKQDVYAQEAVYQRDAIRYRFIALRFVGLRFHFENCDSELSLN